MEGLLKNWRAIASMAAIAALGWLGETGHDGGFVKDIWNSLKTASPPVAMVMFALYLRADARREETLKILEQRTSEFTATTNLGYNTLGVLASRKRSRKRRR